MLQIPLLFSFGQQLRRALFRWLRKVKFFLAFCTVLFAHGLTTGYVAAQLQNGLVGHWSLTTEAALKPSILRAMAIPQPWSMDPLGALPAKSQALSPLTESMTMLLLLRKPKALYPSLLGCMPKRLRGTYFPEL